MAKVLILAKSGFGKTTSLCGRKKFNVEGLNPKETFLIQCANRELPNLGYILITGYRSDGMDLANYISKGNRIQVGNIDGLDKFKIVAQTIELLAKSPFKNIVIDDFNYLSQDYYMANAMKGGWDTPKQIGYGMGLIFKAFESIPTREKDLFAMAHYEEYKDKNGDSISYKFKTTGNMVDGYITPEGKFDIILYGKSGWDDSNKKALKEFVTDFDGEYPAKDSIGVLDECPLYIPNDLGIVKDLINTHYQRDEQN